MANQNKHKNECTHEHEQKLEHKHEHGCECEHECTHEHKPEQNQSCCGYDSTHDQEDLHIHEEVSCSSCGCGSCGHDDESRHDSKSFLLFTVRLIVAALLTAAAALISMPFAAALGLYLIAYLAAGYTVLKAAAKNILHGRVFDENFLMLVATAGAFAIGDYSEGVAVMLFFGIGELLQGFAVRRSRRSIKSLLDLRPESVTLKTEGGTAVTKPETVKIGDIILVRVGERIPLDGIIVSGNTFVDTSALTGESTPREALEGSEVLSGSINQQSIVEIKVTRPFGESAVSRILELAEKAASRKSQSERFITVFARYYTPAVVLAAAAVALFPPLFYGFDTFREWLYRALTFLVVSCPCALVVSIPITYFAGIGGASRRGILVKGANYLDALTRVRTVVFDKTGTLTKGVFKVSAIYPAEGFAKEQVLALAAVAEVGSTHPVARSICTAYETGGELSAAKSRTEHAGKGVAAITADGSILVGNERLMQENGVTPTVCSDAGTVVYVALNGTFAGSIVISDELKPFTKGAITELKRLGIIKTIMLTGDRKEAADAVAKEIGVDSCHAELLPDRKVAVLESLLGSGGVAFVGDGINDAPVLARADVGIAMGGLGSDAAIEAADVVIMDDNPQRVAAAILAARKVKKLVIQNIVFSLGIKSGVLLLALFGIASMWSAVFADTGVALLCVLNALRGLKLKS